MTEQKTISSKQAFKLWQESMVKTLARIDKIILESFAVLQDELEKIDYNRPVSEIYKEIEDLLNSQIEAVNYVKNTGDELHVQVYQSTAFSSRIAASLSVLAVKSNPSKLLAEIYGKSRGGQWSKDLYKDAANSVPIIKKTIQRAIRRKVNFQKTKRKIFDGYKTGGKAPLVKLPKFVNEFLTAARKYGVTGKDYRSFESSLRNLEANIKKLKESGLKAGYNKLLDSFDKKTKTIDLKALQKSMRVALIEKTRNHFDFVVENEGARSWGLGEHYRRMNRDDIVGVPVGDLFLGAVLPQFFCLSRHL